MAVRVKLLIDEKEYDFKHNRIVLTNDTLRDYMISNDL